jgi:signal transduction histidine kinase/DNA-binding response OmpR family regulator
MRQFFKKLSIHKKLVLINFLVLSAALVIVCASFLYIYSQGLSQKMADEIMTHARIVSYNVADALDSSYAQGAADILSSLGKVSLIDRATLFDAQKHFFVEYLNSDLSGPSRSLNSPYIVGDLFVWPDNAPGPVIYGAFYIHVMQPVMKRGEVVGHLYLQVALENYYDSRNRAVTIVLVALALALGISYIVITRMQSLISTPILRLSEAIGKVSKERVYSVRAEKTSEDELGILIDGFNDMLSDIERRDEALKYHKDRLELEVEVQTKDLKAANAELGETIDALREANKTIRISEENKRIAEESAKTKATFLANMSHELRTPMNGALGMLNLLVESSLTNEQRYYTRVALDSASALLAILDDILDLTKVEQGKLDVERIEFNLFQVVDEVFSVLGESAYKKNVELVWYCLGEVPSHVLGDLVRTKQVIYNIVGNSIKFTESGYVSLVLSASPAEDSGDFTIVFRANDTGMGIKKEAQARIFDSFTQADNSTTRRFGGTGLGLSLCRELTKLMGGGISVKSEYGKGSVFTFSVRVGRCDTVLPEPNIPNKPEKVLILDDQTVSLMVLGQYLERLSIEYETTTSPTLFLERLNNREVTYDLVVIDLSLPDAETPELVRQVRGKPLYGETPIVLIGSLEQRSNTEISYGLQTQTQAHWVKPLRFDMVVQGLRELSERLGEEHNHREQQRMEEERSRLESVKIITEKGFKLLVVEDNKVNQQVAVSRLQRMGYLVDTADNGALALEMLQVNRYDLIFMDCQMPVLDGYEATQKIREMNSPKSKLPIIAMTANAMSGDREKCLAAGMNGYLAKPVKNNELVRILAEWLR